MLNSKKLSPVKQKISIQNIMGSCSSKLHVCKIYDIISVYFTFAISIKTCEILRLFVYTIIKTILNSYGKLKGNYEWRN